MWNVVLSKWHHHFLDSWKKIVLLHGLGCGNWYPWQFADGLPQIICRSVYCINAWFCSIALNRMFVLSLSKRCNSFHLRKQHFLQPFIRPTSTIQVGVTCLLVDMYDRIWANSGQLAVSLTSKHVTRREVPQQNCLIHIDWTYTTGWGYLMICEFILVGIETTILHVCKRVRHGRIFTLMDLKLQGLHWKNIWFKLVHRQSIPSKKTNHVVDMNATSMDQGLCMYRRVCIAYWSESNLSSFWGRGCNPDAGLFLHQTLETEHINFPVEGIFGHSATPMFKACSKISK